MWQIKNDLKKDLKKRIKEIKIVVTDYVLKMIFYHLQNYNSIFFKKIRKNFKIIKFVMHPIREWLDVWTLFWGTALFIILSN